MAINFRDEYAKCYQDKTRKYFIEHYLSTFSADEGMEVPFKVFPRQHEFLKSICEHDNTIAIKHRQAGITTVTSAWATAQCVFARRDAPETILCIGNKLDISEQLLEKLGYFIAQVPRWMWGGDYYSPDPNSEKNTKSIFKTRNKDRIELFNGCKIYARSSGPNAARGISAVSILIFDEAAFIENGPAVYSQAVAATASVKHAKIVMVSTPNGKDQLYYRTYEQALSHKNNYNAVEFKWFQDLRYQRNLKWSRKNEKTGDIEWDIDPVINEHGDIPYDEERWRRLEREGWQPESPWYTKMCKSFNNDEQKIAQELDVSFLGSSDNVIPVSVIEAHLQQNVVDVVKIEDWDLWDPFVKETWIWKDPIPGHRYVCCCLPKGESVLTDSGIKHVEDVTFKDKLINTEGNFVDIHRLINRVCDNELIYTIKLKNIIDTITFTGNHPIWSSINTKIQRLKENNKQRQRLFDFQYNKAETLTSGDWIEFPNYYYLNQITDDSIIANKWNEYIDATRKDFDIKNPLLDEDFWYFCGVWIAEGWLSSHGYSKTVCTVHNINENYIYDRLCNIIDKLFNRKANKTINEDTHSVIIRFNSIQLYNFLKDTFNTHAKHKHISEWVKYIPNRFKLQLIDGYIDGDGYISKSGKIDMVSVSKQLLNDVQDLLFSLGVVSSVKLDKKEQITTFRGLKQIHCCDKYKISLGKFDSALFYDLLGYKHNIIKKESRRKKSNCYLSDDNTKIYIQINGISSSVYNGIVYNFETKTHSYCGRYIATHNCDASSGSAEDRTAIEVIDIDAVDEQTGTPYFDQVLEYYGKRTGDEIGEMVYNYATAYNNALVVVECIGGYGDAIILTLMAKKYKNIYYDDPGLKTYTVEKAYSTFNIKVGDKLPGFRTNAVRVQMIGNFVSMLKDNAFRVRSTRVITEMDTWIWKSGRPDHMDGCHDDSLTCLAMGLFVIQFYVIKSDRDKSKSHVMLRSFRVNNAGREASRQDITYNEPISNTRPMPFYGGGSDERRRQKQMAAMLMLAGFKKR